MSPRPAFERVAPRLHPAAEEGIDSRTIGRILVDLGKLRQQDVARVFALHRQKGMRFGEAARKLRLVRDDDVRQALAVQFNHPYVERGRAALGAELVLAHEAETPQAEALRDLRTQLLLEWLNAERKVLAVVSPGAREGRSYLAANLAVAFAQLGEQTLLIDADLRGPRQHSIFGVAGKPGLAHALSGRAGLDAAERIPYFGNLAVLTAGATPPNPLELLSRPEFARVIGEARRLYSVVILDTPAGGRGSDVKVVAARSDGALMLAREDRTRVADMEYLRRSLGACGVPVIGTVLNTV
jgi:chain length determinant protein tyrosine kinase EpsG